MIPVRNVSGGLVMVGENYLFPTEARLVDEATAVAVLASGAGLVVASHPDHPGSRLELLAEGQSLPEDKALLSSEKPSPPAPLPGSGEGGKEPHPSPPQIGEGADVSLGDGDDLTVIRGIGPRVAEALGVLGVRSLGELAGWDGAALAAALDGSSERQVQGWIVQAQDLLAEEG